METAFAAANRKRFLNKGLFNGVMIPTYGIGMTIIILLFSPSKNNVAFLFIASVVVATIVEYFAGALTERIFKKKPWDYTGHVLSIGGRVCLKFSIVWGIIATFVVKIIQPLFDRIIVLIDYPVTTIIVWIIFGILILDILITLSAFIYGKHQNKIVQEVAEEVAEELQKTSKKLSKIIYSKVQSRLYKAYPNLEKETETVEVDKNIFAAGCGAFKPLWLFMIGAFLGDIIETIFCYFTTGNLMSRSSVIYGPFSIVWGLGIALMTPILYRFKDSQDSKIFIAGTLMGGVYEYGCSVFTERFLGKVFWDYSGIPFNIGGRINLLYCFFWGIAALVWVKAAYPFLSGLIEKIPRKIGYIVSYIIIVFMTFNIIISAAALVRHDERTDKIEAENSIQTFLDKHYDDELIERVYPNAIEK